MAEHENRRPADSQEQACTKASPSAPNRYVEEAKVVSGINRIVVDALAVVVVLAAVGIGFYVSSFVVAIIVLAVGGAAYAKVREDWQKERQAQLVEQLLARDGAKKED